MTNTTPRSFAELLAESRARAGWSRREIADAAGITPQFVAYLETGDRKPSDDTVERLITERLITAMDLPPRTAGLFRRFAAAER